MVDQKVVQSRIGKTRLLTQKDHHAALQSRCAAKKKSFSVNCRERARSCRRRVKGDELKSAFCRGVPLVGITFASFGFHVLIYTVLHKS
jgi:hypothetical protein